MCEFDSDKICKYYLVSINMLKCKAINKKK